MICVTPDVKDSLFPLLAVMIFNTQERKKERKSSQVGTESAPLSYVQGQGVPAPLWNDIQHPALMEAHIKANLKSSIL